jgi:hypothetical protein
MSNGKSYWRASEKLSDAIREFWKADIENTKQVQELAEEIGAECGLMGIYWGRTCCLGFEFKTPPDPKKFYKHERYENGYIPRANSRNKNSIRSRMSRLQSTMMGDVCDLIKFEPITSEGSGLGYWNPGLRQHNKIFYLTLPEDFKPAKGVELTRISDIEFENLKSKKRRTKKCRA